AISAASATAGVSRRPGPDPLNRNPVPTSCPSCNGRTTEFLVHFRAKLNPKSATPAIRRSARGQAYSARSPTLENHPPDCDKRKPRLGLGGRMKIRRFSLGASALMIALAVSGCTHRLLPKSGAKTVKVYQDEDIYKGIL